jgi:hypothetical protein
MRYFPGWLIAAAVAGPMPAQQPPPSFKHLDIANAAGVWVGFAVQNRTRFEHWGNFGFGTAPQSDADYALNRFLVSADLHIGPAARLYIEGKSAVLTDRNLPGGRRPSDADDLDLQNGYAEVTARPGIATLSGRIGRQELLFGKQRLISPLDWANTRRTFDGLRGTATVRSWTVDAFFTHPVRVLKSSFNTWDGSVDFFGLYAQKKAGRFQATDLYWLGLNRPNATFNGTTGDEHRHTLGVRFSAKAPSLVEYDLEGAYQFGSIGSTISAVMIGSDVAHTWSANRLHPRLHAGFDYASGDATPGGNVGTFNQLFPLGHAFLGFIDVVGRQNIVAPSAGLGVAPTARLTMDATYSYFARASERDALYNAAGSVERAAGSANAKSIGTELDLTATYRVGTTASVLLGYSRLWPGAFIQQTGAARTTDFAYASLQLSY